MSPPQTVRPREQWRRNQFVAVASGVLVDTAYYLMVPAMPQFVRELGVSSPARIAMWVGLLIGIAPLIAGFAGPLWGRLADRGGLKIHALRTTLALSVIYFLSSRCATVYELLPLRILLGLVGGYQSLTVALATQICPPPHIPAVIGSLQIGQIAAAAAAPVAGGILAAAFGIRRTLVISSLLCLSGSLLYLRWYRDGSAPRPRERNGAAEPPARLWSTPNFAVLAVLVLTLAVIDKSMQPAIPLFVLAHSEDRWRAARVAGVILSLAALADTAAVWYCGERMRRGASPEALLAVRWGAGMALCCVLAACSTVTLFAASRILLSLLAGGTMTVLYSLASTIIPPRQRATGFAMLASCALVGAGLGPLLLSATAAENLRVLFAGDALFYAALAALALTRLRFRPDPDRGPSALAHHGGDLRAGSQP